MRRRRLRLNSTKDTNERGSTHKSSCPHSALSGVDSNKLLLLFDQSWLWRKVIEAHWVSRSVLTPLSRFLTAR